MLWKKRQENQQKTVLKIVMIRLKQFSKSLKKYEKHQSIVEIRKNLKWTETFKVPKAEVSDINKLLKNINIKATGPGTMPPKLVKLSANIVDSHLCNIIN